MQATGTNPQNVNSYNSQYPLDYYELGEVYSFYTSDPKLKMTVKDATHPDEKLAKEFIDKYKGKLDSLYDEPGTAGSGNTFGTTIRFLGIVVDKVSAEKYSYITVLVKAKNGDDYEYYFKKYLVSGAKAFCDDKEGPASVACIGAVTPKKAYPIPVDDGKKKKAGPVEEGKKTGPAEM